MSKNTRILVVDDDRFMREMFRVILTRAGYEVLFAEDGATAVEMASIEKPDLVLTDGLLPKMHGFLVCKTIKQFDSPPKVILVTAVYTKPTYKWEVKKEYGADDILTKPFAAGDLLTCIEKHLSERTPRNDPQAGVTDQADHAAEKTISRSQSAAGSGSRAAPENTGSDPVIEDSNSIAFVRHFSVIPAA